MFTLDFVTAWGTTFPLVGNPLFKITNIDGLTDMSADISSTDTIGTDGDSVTNVKAQPRSIVIDLTINEGVNVENAKRTVLSYVKFKAAGALLWTQNKKEKRIQGIVENVSMPRFTNQAVMQITLYCSQPYWEDINEFVTQITQFLDLHKFPIAFPEAGVPFGRYNNDTLTQTFTNNGDVAIGAVFEIITLTEDLIHPVIYDKDRNSFGVNVTVSKGDTLVINTIKGQKSVTMNGKNLISKIDKGITWLELALGDNEFSLQFDHGDATSAYMRIRYKQKYV
jgi:hypothetical protein|nr:MAG TPA: tail protein [Caudoviricetes sp.]